MPPTPKKLIDPRPERRRSPPRLPTSTSQRDGLMYVSDWNAGLNVLQYQRVGKTRNDEDHHIASHRGSHDGILAGTRPGAAGRYGAPQREDPHVRSCIFDA